MEVFEASVGELDEAPFPFPPGTVSMHIRHGDKGIEMKLVPTMDYVRAAEEVQYHLPVSFARRTAFLSTEDPGAIAEASTAYEAGDVKGVGPYWTMFWYDVPRNNIDGRTQLTAFASGSKKQMSRAHLTRIWWLQLLMALECDAWVGTRGSNWNRLIDELRCVWVGKCFNPYVEVGSRKRGEQWFNVAT